MKSANSINKSDNMKGLLFRSALIALLAIPGVAEAGARKDLPTCDKAKEILAKDNRKKVKTWAEKTCKCTVSLKRKLDRIGPRFQDSYDEECGKNVLSAKPPKKTVARPSEGGGTKAEKIKKLAEEIEKLMEEKNWDEAEKKANEILKLHKKNKFAKGILKQIAEEREKEEGEKTDWTWLLTLLKILGAATVLDIVGRIGNSRLKKAIRQLQEEDNPDLAECVGEEYEPTEPVKQNPWPIIGTGINLFVKNPHQFKEEASINNDLRREFEAQFGKDKKGPIRKASARKKPLPRKKRSQRNR